MITNISCILLRKFKVTKQIPKVDLVFENGQKIKVQNRKSK